MATPVRGERDEEPRSVERPVYEPSAADKLEWQRRLLVGSKAELKGSIGEGPNQTNYSDQSSEDSRIFHIKFNNFENFNISELSAKFRQNEQKAMTKNKILQKFAKKRGNFLKY